MWEGGRNREANGRILTSGLLYFLQIDSVNKQGLLLEVVQVLTDMNLTILKGYISSDAGWFMDGNYQSYKNFNVTFEVGILAINIKMHEEH